MDNYNNSSNKNQKTYVLFIPLSSEKGIDSVNWRKLSRRFGFNLIRERKNLATVEANPQQIKEFQESYPKIEVTIRKRYKFSFA